MATEYKIDIGRDGTELDLKVTSQVLEVETNAFDLTLSRVGGVGAKGNRDDLEAMYSSVELNPGNPDDQPGNWEPIPQTPNYHLALRFVERDSGGNLISEGNWDIIPLPVGEQGEAVTGVTVVAGGTTPGVATTIQFSGPSGNVGGQVIIQPGAVGAQGDIGPRGNTGATGDNGMDSVVPGPIGPKGDIGLTGADSTVAGPRGLQGMQGIQGNRGDTGDTGADSTVAGPTGPRGLQGEQGDMGDTGADSTVAGPIGPQGVIGLTGAASTVAGPAGPQGGEGDQGIPGPDGPQGDVGPLASIAITRTLTGQEGTDARFSLRSDSTPALAKYDAFIPIGDTGAQGPPGAVSVVPGPTGPQGPIGLTGSQGIRGNTGAASTVVGPAGPRGIQGEMGDTGADSTVPGPVGPASTVPGPQGDAAITGFNITRGGNDTGSFTNGQINLMLKDIGTPVNPPNPTVMFSVLGVFNLEEMSTSQTLDISIGATRTGGNPTDLIVQSYTISQAARGFVHIIDNPTDTDKTDNLVGSQVTLSADSGGGTSFTITVDMTYNLDGNSHSHSQLLRYNVGETWFSEVSTTEPVDMSAATDLGPYVVGDVALLTGVAGDTFYLWLPTSSTDPVFTADDAGGFSIEVDILTVIDGDHTLWTAGPLSGPGTLAFYVEKI